MKRKMLIYLSLCAVLLISCSTGNSDGSNKSTDDKTIISESSNCSTDKSTEKVSNEDNTERISENVEGTVTIEQPVKEEETLPDDNEIADENMSQKVKDYILLGQVEKPAAEQLKWNAKFLEQVDIDSLYEKYVANGGNENDVEAVATYITENAPIASNWQEMFEEEINSIYGEKISKVEYLEGDLYTAYVIKDGKEVPYVTVNARTGYFHG